MSYASKTSLVSISEGPGPAKELKGLRIRELEEWCTTQGKLQAE